MHSYLWVQPPHLDDSRIHPKFARRNSSLSIPMVSSRNGRPCCSAIHCCTHPRGTNATAGLFRQSRPLLGLRGASLLLPFMRDHSLGEVVAPRSPCLLQDADPQHSHPLGGSTRKRTDCHNQPGPCLAIVPKTLHQDTAIRNLSSLSHRRLKARRHPSNQKRVIFTMYVRVHVSMYE